MPTTYTHYSFGDEILEALPSELKKTVLKYRSLYNYGVHGPDIFFYYQVFKHNEVNSYGSDMHYQSACTFFKRCKDVYLHNDEKEAVLSYILGFLTHFFLDSYTHSYIENKMEKSQISHNKIESQYDRHLMLVNNINPLKYDRSKLVKPSVLNSKIISYFFDYDQKIIFDCMNGQVTSLRFLYAAAKLRRQFVNNVSKKFKLNPNFIDLVIDKEELSTCRDSNLRLDKLKIKAKEKLLFLLPHFMAYLNGQEDKLDVYFENHFSQQADYRDIPVLQYEDELKYEL